MSWEWLAVSHAVTACAAAGLTYLVVRQASPPTPGASMDLTEPVPTDAEPKRKPRRQLPTWAVVLVASFVIIILGVQMRLAQNDNKARDHDRAVQDAHDRDRQDCLNGFAADLVETIKTRNAANRRVAAAQEAKDRALDHLFDVVVAARTLPPDQAQRVFQEAVDRRVKAQERLARVKAQTDATLAQNPYRDPKTPKVVCE